MRYETYIDEGGYLRFIDDNTPYSNLVHRQIAYELIYNSDEYQHHFSEYEVHHKDHNKLNNSVSNLEILTTEEHMNVHGYNDKCFIATAAYGTPFAEEINVLRFWRDNYLKTNVWGVFFVKFYYWFSPPIAGKIRTNNYLKMVTRMCLNPIVKMLKMRYNYIINNNA